VLARELLWGERSQFLRFVLVGFANTAGTYVIYLTLCQLVHYKVAYALSFGAGVVLSYLGQAFLVFRTRPMPDTAAKFPLVYIIQFVVGIVVLTLLVEVASTPHEIGVLASIVINIPLTFLLSRTLFTRQGEKKRKDSV
jgi:putative flippase GtrA